jgi:vancomycin permeability regulator SanA
MSAVTHVESQPSDLRAPSACAIARALALFIGGFTLLNIVGELLSPGFDANIWWIDLRPLHPTMSQSLLLLTSAHLIAFAIWPKMAHWRRICTSVMIGIVFIVAIWNCFVFYQLLNKDRIHGSIGIPLSALIAAGMFCIALTILREPSPRPLKISERWAFSIILLICAIGLPVAKMYFFGRTDYRHHADVVVVFGARAYANGKPSDALADRVRTACDLYRASIVRKLLMTGGPGDGAIHETESMRLFALSLGVNNRDIILDSQGVNTAASVSSTIPIIEQLQARRVLTVSHFYHLPRIKMTYQRAGREVYTVPARETYTLRAMPFLMAREVVALWKYYLSPLGIRC